MSVTPTKAVSLYMLQAYAEYLDLGGLNATFVFYEGIRAESIDDAADNTNKLVTCILPKPSFKQVLADYIELNASDAGLVTKSGTATWCRIYNGQGLPVLDLGVGEEITLNNADLVQGTTLMLNSIKFSPSL